MSESVGKQKMAELVVNAGFGNRNNAKEAQANSKRKQPANYDGEGSTARDRDKDAMGRREKSAERETPHDQSGDNRKEQLNLSFEHGVDVLNKAFSNGLTGEWITSFALVALSFPLLWRGGALTFFLLATTALSVVNAIVYSQVWHYGTIFLAWIAALWIACRRVYDHPPTAIRNWGLTAMVLVVAVQCWWTASAVGYDIAHDYSAGRSAAAGIRELSLDGRRIYGIGFACVAIQPYFARNIFANWNDGQPAAYWDWSTRNHVNEDARHLADSRPDYVIVGYKNEYERGIWTDLVRQAGYHQIRHFEGNTFWQTHVFEPESFDLFYVGVH